VRRIRRERERERGEIKWCAVYLFELEHVVIEELLELLVRVVDAELLEAVVLEDLEASNVQHADEVLEFALACRDV
jgi:hypothetical protein